MTEIQYEKYLAANQFSHDVAEVMRKSPVKSQYDRKGMMKLGRDFKADLQSLVDKYSKLSTEYKENI